MRHDENGCATLHGTPELIKIRRTIRNTMETDTRHFARYSRIQTCNTLDGTLKQIKTWQNIRGTMKTKARHFARHSRTWRFALYSGINLDVTKTIRSTLKTALFNMESASNASHLISYWYRFVAMQWILSFHFKINLSGTKSFYQRQDLLNGRVIL